MPRAQARSFLDSWLPNPNSNPTPNPPTPMAVPLSWNLAGKRWNAGLKWNDLIDTTRTMKSKAITDFASYVAAELSPVAQTIHDQMTGNSAIFTAPPTSVAALQTLINTYNAKLAARASNASVDVLAFSLARHDLEVALHDIGVYVNLVAKGDPMIVEKSGFPSYSFGGGATPGPSPIPAAPQNVRLRNGDLSCSAIARMKPDRVHSFNVAQTNTGNPNVEADWHTVLQFSGGKATLAGFTIGSIVWFRFATVGPGGVVGAWSDPAKLVIT